MNNTTFGVQFAPAFPIGRNFNSLGKYYEHENAMKAYYIFFFLTDVMIMLPVILGNSLILISIARYRRLRTRLYALIANLAVSDLLVGLLVIPFDAAILLKKNYWRQKYVCLTRLCLGNTVVLTSIMNLFLISLERYLAIVHPFHYIKVYTKSRMVIGIVSSWCVTTVLGFLPITGINTWHSESPCDPDFVLDDGYRGFVYLLVLCSIIGNICMYAVVAKKAWKQTRRLGGLGNGGSSEDGRHKITPSAKNLRKTKIMILVFGVFAICWGPYCVLIILETFVLPTGEYIVIIRKFAGCVGLLNSGLNWFMYGAMNKGFRKAFKLILSCTSSSHDNSLAVSTSSD